MRGFAGRIFSFSGLQILSGISPLLILPVISRVSGPDGWSSIAIGQSIGAIAAAVILYGWGLTGPAKVAVAPTAERGGLYRDSVLTRSALTLVMAPLAAVGAALLAFAEFRVEAAIMAVGMALMGLAPNWYAVGIGRARIVAAFDTVPRLAVTIGSSLLIIVTGNILIYPVLLTVVGLVTAWLAHRTLSERRRLSRGDLKVVQANLRFRFKPAASALTMATYESFPVSLMSIVSLPSVAVFAAAERINRYGMIIIYSASNSLQGWVAGTGSAARKRRLTALLFHTVLGLTGAAVMVFFGPWLSTVLFGSLITIGSDTALFFGLSLGLMSITTSINFHIFIPLGLNTQVFVGTLIAASVSVAAVSVLGGLYGAPGGALGVLCAQLALLLWQIIVLLRHRSEVRVHNRSDGS
ncbi:O-antigen/teichoic acid export membrane protein [Mycetocola sp. BIGb0189]|uniref:lipopolysaccharide biosynthesis protein n=1 Tax=Mycetocola sp. BIGb0189 TaxID=2940604 RepID=UPI00216A047F|nr:hypothetical protein [Mycetocola sp. BIGb0189]MCS4277520.1 O-antigen/teichoic acid export membrane protein [Mycetocola sp. BIGb0189]